MDTKEMYNKYADHYNGGEPFTVLSEFIIIQNRLDERYKDSQKEIENYTDRLKDKLNDVVEAELESNNNEANKRVNSIIKPLVYPNLGYYAPKIKESYFNPIFKEIIKLYEFLKVKPEIIHLLPKDINELVEQKYLSCVIDREDHRLYMGCIKIIHSIIHELDRDYKKESHQRNTIREVINMIIGYEYKPIPKWNNLSGEEQDQIQQQGRPLNNADTQEEVRRYYEDNKETLEAEDTEAAMVRLILGALDEKLCISREYKDPERTIKYWLNGY